MDFLQNAATKLAFTISNARLLKSQLKEIEERKVLIRELYHRTKNNMQVISSLLGLKAAIVQDQETKDILGDMGNRISTIALVHQMLYQSQNLSRIDLKDYITELANLLMQSYSVEHKYISLVLELESISVVIDTAIPCGLIINELISNSLKYAFPGDMKGEIRIHLAKVDKDIIELKISDNGIGIPPEYDVMDNSTLGLQIFWNIAEGQLQGEVDFQTLNGVSCSIRFRDALYTERV
jgi:two-component sensor histidine kinase